MLKIFSFNRLASGINRPANGIFRPMIGIALLLVFASGVASAQTLSPPDLGDETKGTPAIDEKTRAEQAITREAAPAEEEAVAESDGGALGIATVTESRRESGQLYLIELEHSLGSKQYIEETDSDGKIESTSNDIEETPNLPKWKLGSW